MSDEHPHESCNGRRTFCKVCIGGMAAASAGMVAYPVASLVLTRPLRVGSDKPVEIALDQLAPGQAQYAELRGQQVVVLSSEDGPRVFNASCPHLGCNVTWDTAQAVFRCPCHGAVFDNGGAVVSGPVSSPLAPVPFEVKDGKLTIT